MKKLIIGACTLSFVFTMALSFTGHSSSKESMSKDIMPPTVVANSYY